MTGPAVTGGGVVESVDLDGMRPFMVECRAFPSPGPPRLDLTGLDTPWDGAGSRVRLAADQMRLRWPEGRVLVELSPAAARKRSGIHDLAVALSVIDMEGGLSRPSDMGPSDRLTAIGGLDEHGNVTAVRGVVSMLEHCRAQGVRHVVIPRDNLGDAHMVEGLVLHPVRTLRDAATRLGSLRFDGYAMPDRRGAQVNVSWDGDPRLDGVRNAAVAAAAGRHHMLIRTDLQSHARVDRIVRCMQAMAPRLDERQAMELARVRDLLGVIGPLGVGLDDLPPMVAPFHTKTTSGMVGDSREPGAASLADHGVLYLDEMQWFSVRTLMALKDPMDRGRTAEGGVSWPADIQLVGVMNRCACGAAPESCLCSEREMTRYESRTSLLDDRCAIRIDSAEPATMPAPDLDEATAMVRDARARQSARFESAPFDSNARADRDWIRDHTPSSVTGLIGERVPEGDGSRLSLATARLAWTMADLGCRREPTEEDALRALGMALNTGAGLESDGPASFVCDPADPLLQSAAAASGITH